MWQLANPYNVQANLYNVQGPVCADWIMAERNDMYPMPWGADGMEPPTDTPGASPPNMSTHMNTHPAPAHMTQPQSPMHNMFPQMSVTSPNSMRQMTVHHPPTSSSVSSRATDTPVNTPSSTSSSIAHMTQPPSPMHNNNIFPPMTSPSSMPQMTVHHPPVSTSVTSSASNSDTPANTSLGAPHNTPLVVPQPVKTMKPTTKTYHCRMCNQIFNSKSDLLVHSHQVHKQDPKPYKCPTCNKCFANSSYLSQHARIHAGIKPYKCQICERRFTQLCHLQQHIRTHTGEKPYKCQHPGCGKAFSQLSNLQSHSRSHMTDKPFRCNSCYKCYADEQSLREHIPKHSETKHLKTHICHICGKSYTQETYLTRHMAKHTGEGNNNNSRITSIQRQTSAPAALMSNSTNANANTPHPEIFDMKPPMNSMPGPGMNEPCCKPSAFIPISQPFAASVSSVPSMVPFNPAHLASNSISPSLQHLSPPPGSSRYFPFDPMPFKRDTVERSLSSPRDGMLPNHYLSLQDIKNYSLYHQMALKQEPDSPMHKDYTQLGK